MIRRYKKEDLPLVQNLLRLNTPKYFAADEELDYLEYLEQDAEYYFVFEEKESILGCGGYNYFIEENIVRISWDIIHPDAQGKGIGKALTHFRIEEIKKQWPTAMIHVRTSQYAVGFYEKMGFTLDSIKKDFWAKGYDMYHMFLT